MAERKAARVIRRGGLAGLALAAGMTALAPEASATPPPIDPTTITVGVPGDRTVYTGMMLYPGETVSVSASGHWNVDVRNFPDVGPEGYTEDIDRQIYPGCRLDETAAYGVLLADLNGETLPIGTGRTFTSNVFAPFKLEINDRPECRGDNQKPGEEPKIVYATIYVRS